jgi:TorA maturation chaperone TorD
VRLTTAMPMAIVAGIAAGGSVLGQERTHIQLAPALNGFAMTQDTESPDTAIERAFRSVLNREPSSTELRRYRVLVRENEWGEAEVRRDLSERPDYRRFSKAGGVEPETIIRRAYQDILGRDPDAEGMRTYRSKMIDEGWPERDVREALRRSGEHASSERRYASADRIIRRAYEDILGREPDPEGLQTFRRHIVEDGFDEHDVRQALARSPEKRQRQVISEAEAADMVRRAYRAVLNREPDATGMRDYTARVLRDHWNDQQITDELRKSEEYRRKRQ